MVSVPSMGWNGLYSALCSMIYFIRRYWQQEMGDKATFVRFNLFLFIGWTMHRISEPSIQIHFEIGKMVNHVFVSWLWLCFWSTYTQKLRKKNLQNEIDKLRGKTKINSIFDSIHFPSYSYVIDELVLTFRYLLAKGSHTFSVSPNLFHWIFTLNLLT